MNGTGVDDEVHAGPREPCEEIAREHVAFEPIASAAGGDEVAGDVRAALGERMHMVEGRDVELEGSGAVHTAPAAITHRGALDRTLLGEVIDAPRAAGNAGNAWEGDAVTVSTSRQGHLAEKAKPRRGKDSRGGAWQRKRRHTD